MPRSSKLSDNDWGGRDSSLYSSSQKRQRPVAAPKSQAERFQQAENDMRAMLNEFADKDKHNK